jgi:hypothetical protein
MYIVWCIENDGYIQGLLRPTSIEHDLVGKAHVDSIRDPLLASIEFPYEGTEFPPSQHCYDLGEREGSSVGTSRAACAAV